MTHKVRSIGGLSALQRLSMRKSLGLGDGEEEDYTSYASLEAQYGSGEETPAEDTSTNSWQDYLPSWDTVGDVFKIGTQIVGSGSSNPSPKQTQSGYPAPKQTQSGYPQSGYPQSGYPQSGYPQQGYGQPDAPSMVLPLAIGGGVLVIGLFAILMLRK